MSGSTGSAYNKDYYKTEWNDEDDDMIDKISDYKGNYYNIRYVGWLFIISAILGLYISIQYFIIFFEESFYLDKKEENREIPKENVGDMQYIINNLNTPYYYYSNIIVVVLLSVCLIFFIAGNSVWWMNGGISDALKSERKMAQNLSMVVAAPERLQSAAGLLSSYIYPKGDKNGSPQEKEDYYGQQALGKQLEQSIRNEFYDKNAKKEYEPIYDDYDPQKEAEARAYERTEQAFAPQEGAPETYDQWAVRNRLRREAQKGLDPNRETEEQKQNQLSAKAQAQAREEEDQIQAENELEQESKDAIDAVDFKNRQLEENQKNLQDYYDTLNDRGDFNEKNKTQAKMHNIETEAYKLGKLKDQHNRDLAQIRQNRDERTASP